MHRNRGIENEIPTPALFPEKSPIKFDPKLYEDEDITYDKT